MSNLDSACIGDKKNTLGTKRIFNRIRGGLVATTKKWDLTKIIIGIPTGNCRQATYFNNYSAVSLYCVTKIFIFDCVYLILYEKILYYYNFIN